MSGKQGEKMKILKILLLSVAVLIVVTAVAAAVAIKVFLPEDKIKSYIVDYAKTNFNREVSFDKLSFTFIGIDLKNFSMSETKTANDTGLPREQSSLAMTDTNKTTNDNGKTAKTNKENPHQVQDNKTDFVTAEHFTVKISPFPLLRKEIKIGNILLNNAKINITKGKDGKFNFENLTATTGTPTTNLGDDTASQSTTELKTSTANGNNKMTSKNNSEWAVNIQNLNIKNANVNYTDKQNNLSASIKNFNLEIKDFSFTEPFECETSCDIDAKQNELHIALPLKANFKTYLANFDMDKMLLNIESLATSYNNADFSLNGTVKNINNPKIDCGITIKNINEKTFKDFVKLNKFSIDKIDFKTKTAVNISSKNADIESLSLVLPDSSSNISGTADWSKEDLQYNLTGNLNLKYNGAEISANGKIETKTSSALTLSLKAKNITNDTAKDFYQCPIKFIIPTLNINSVVNFNLKNNTANLTKLNIKIPDSSANISGKLNWNDKKNFVYNLALNLDFLLDNIANSFPEYNMKGRIKSDAKVSEKDFSGTINLNNVSFDYLPIAQISKLNADVSAKSKNNITLKTASGIFNEGKFNANGSFINKDIKLNLDMDKLKVNTTEGQKIGNDKKTTAKDAGLPREQSSLAMTDKNKTSNAGKTEYYNIYTNININNIDVPYLISKNATLKTSLKSVSADMKKADGNVNLVISTGTITNVDKLAENKYAKLFLLIFNALNNNITSKSKSNGIDYENMTANISFTDGVMKTNNVSIKIPLTTMDVKGTVNFKNENVDLKVNTGLYAAMKITGTISNPKTSFDAVSTAAQVLSGSKNIEEIGQKLGNSLKNLFK